MPRTIMEAEAIQDELSALLDLTGPGPRSPAKVAGVDVVGKTAFVGTYPEPAPERGSWTDLTLDGDVVGRVLRTRHGVKPVFVSTGHRVDLATACHNVLNLTPRYRLPETTRAADRLSREALIENCRPDLIGSAQYDEMG
ncbi:endonuclease V [Streptosporangium sp. NBC_01755]|uniref:endonuclease V n=1 Tax=unclassified Streptosporangium TaxID=2632669 RepID=UPI002DD9D74F|nr:MULTISPECIES: endonuclease V [unclassified Streptosporangium]WSA28951.1 endonuclease V [Streptosporangium sp. NBC_01810]WSC99602.1 endonuclease V [Streptosporangium sp. NBC_01755]